MNSKKVPCLRHPRHVIGYRGSKKRLAHNVGRMAYDEVADFVGELAIDIKHQADDDRLLRRRNKLAGELEEAARYLALAQARLQSAWKICEPFMKSSNPS